MASKKIPLSYEPPRNQQDLRDSDAQYRQAKRGKAVKGLVYQGASGNVYDDNVRPKNPARVQYQWLSRIRKDANKRGYTRRARKNRSN